MAIRKMNRATRRSEGDIAGSTFYWRATFVVPESVWSLCSLFSSTPARVFMQFPFPSSTNLGSRNVLYFWTCARHKESRQGYKKNIELLLRSFTSCFFCWPSFLLKEEVLVATTAAENGGDEKRDQKRDHCHDSLIPIKQDDFLQPCSHQICTCQWTQDPQACFFATSVPYGQRRRRCSSLDQQWCGFGYGQVILSIAFQAKVLLWWHKSLHVHEWRR